MTFSPLDTIVFVAYCLVVIGTGLWVSRGKKGVEKTSTEYFLADKSLPWWAIGSSLIASNISAEQFIGMSGSGYAIGLGIATYEWMAAATLIVVGKFFLPIYLEKKIFTMPQFLQNRYDNRVRTSLAIFWILLYILVNLTSVLYLGALSLQTITGLPLIYGIIGLAVFSAVYSIYGGLEAVAWTDVIQVVFLIGGGLVTTFLALQAVGNGDGVLAGFDILLQKAPERFNMIFEAEEEGYDLLPGLSVLIGGMWITNLSYWGCNQYITQRALAAKDLAEAQKGVLFAGYLKLLMPLIVVIPGIAAYVLTTSPEYANVATGAVSKPDEAYPWLVNAFVFTGVKGAVFAALIAAIVSSLSSMTNSTATIFTMDIYRQLVKGEPREAKLVAVGRTMGIVSLVIAVCIAPLLSTLGQAFQFIQEYTGFVSPGVIAIFGFGLFWRKTTANAAIWAAILTIPLSAILKFTFPALPFIDRMGVVFVILAIVMVTISLIENKGANDPKAVHYSKSLFYTGPAFNIGAIGICLILAFLYIRFW
jgi:solute:Na+ symporter, SSS family